MSGVLCGNFFYRQRRRRDRHGYAVEDQRIMETVAGRIMALIEGETDGKVVPIRR
jgi:hypothetical protein